jgi:hypothetical protein
MPKPPEELKDFSRFRTVPNNFHNRQPGLKNFPPITGMKNSYAADQYMPAIEQHKKLAIHIR